MHPSAPLLLQRKWSNSLFLSLCCCLYPSRRSDESSR